MTAALHFILASTLLEAAQAKQRAQHGTALEKALGFFGAIRPLTFDNVLRKVAKPPASARDLKAGLTAFERAVAEGGEVTRFASRERAKIEAMDRMLPAFERRLLQIRVIDAPNAFVGLHRRAILLVTLPALRLLSASELQGMVAHETAHDLMWERWESARAVGNRGVLHEIELLCDGLAVLALISTGGDPFSWTSGLEKLEAYNRQRFGTAAQDERYPSLSERKKLAETVMGWISRER